MFIIPATWEVEASPDKVSKDPASKHKTQTKGSGMRLKWQTTYLTCARSWVKTQYHLEKEARAMHTLYPWALFTR
jgi:hypothetical protein